LIDCYRQVSHPIFHLCCFKEYRTNERPHKTLARDVSTNKEVGMTGTIIVSYYRLSFSKEVDETT